MSTTKAEKKKTRKALTDEQKQERQRRQKETAFRKKIRSTFSNMGFTSFAVTNKYPKIGHRVVELDHLFIYENVMIICEDTCKKDKDKDHIRTKSESFHEIQNNISQLLDWLIKEFPENRTIFEKYLPQRWQVFYIYISQSELNITEDEKALYSNLIFWEPDTLEYFCRISQRIFFSARYELFRFLNLKSNQICQINSSGHKATISAPIIYPEEAVSFDNGIRVVSFMMSADMLLRTCYVLRKDNWEDSIWLYQRLIEKEKIKNIRAFLAKKGAAFYNNIIVALPDTVGFSTEHGPVTIDKLDPFQHCTLEIPDEMNSICVIDGQHRIFAHYEAPATEKYEHIIASLRERHHLLVTGLIFPSTINEAERLRIQSEIFLDINSNAKQVPPDVLIHIEKMRNPLSDIGLARQVVERLNKKSVFFKRFELSALDEGKIKIASIIKFALRYLVTINPTDGKSTLYTYWDGNKSSLLEMIPDAIDKYVEFCANKLNEYFSAVKSAFPEDWADPNSKLLSVISINGFIIAYTRQLSSYGIQNYEFYLEKFKKLHIDFSKENFPYTSSQYRKFSNQILTQAFGFSEEDLLTI